MSFSLTCSASKKLPCIGKRIGSSIAMTLRSFASRKNCAVHEEPLCAKERLAKLPPCPDKVRRQEAKEELPKPNSMWEDPECCRELCPNYLPRYDELYYKSSDKAKRKYQQTWVSVPKLKMESKIVCVFETPKLHPMEYRIVKKPKKSSCPIGGSRVCKTLGALKFARVKSPKCPRSRVPPKCENQRRPLDCEKECAPYPSYSECIHVDPTLLNPAECKCMNKQMMCQVWAEMRRRTTFVKVV